MDPRSAVRIARIVSEAINMSLPDVRWFVFGDDEHRLLPQQSVKTPSKYDHELWYYVGIDYESFDRIETLGSIWRIGARGFALSSSLAKVLGKVLDSCLERYPHVFGSDGGIHSC
ncbi:hypothetical protein Dimus_011527, partial [Dionaea muscipula]